MCIGVCIVANDKQRRHISPTRRPHAPGQPHPPVRRSSACLIPAVREEWTLVCHAAGYTGFSTNKSSWFAPNAFNVPHRSPSPTLTPSLTRLRPQPNLGSHLACRPRVPLVRARHHRVSHRRRSNSLWAREQRGCTAIKLRGATEGMLTFPPLQAPTAYKAANLVGDRRRDGVCGEPEAEKARPWVKNNHIGPADEQLVLLALQGWRQTSVPLRQKQCRDGEGKNIHVLRTDL